MARPDKGRRRTWRFKIEDSTILEVTAPRGATEKQVRRRGRWSLILGTLIAALMLVAVAAADNFDADADAFATSPPAGNEASANQQPGTTVEYDLSAAIRNTGNSNNDVFKISGDTVNVTIARSGDWLASPAGSPTSFSFTTYDTNQAGKIRIAVPCGTGAGTLRVMEAVLTAVASNGQTLSPSTVTLTWTITAQGADAASCTPANTAPSVAADNAAVTVDEGDLASNTGTWSDANAGDTVTLSASIGSISQAGTNAAGTWSWSFQTTDGPDESQTVTITANDTHTTSSTTFSLVVDNVAPTVAFTGGPTSVDESSSAVTYSYSIDDPGTDTVQSVTVSCGSLGTASNETNTDTSGSFDCTFLDGLNPATTSDVTIQATDSDGLAGNTALTTVTVSNAKPVVSALTLGGNSGTACIGGNTATLDFGFSDAGVNDNPWAVDINWGDGNHTTYNASAQGTQTQRSHVYAAGSYTVSVSVTDKDGGTDSSSSAAGAVSFLYNVSGVLQPVNDTQAHNDPSVFKYGSTIPVKIKVTDCNNVVVSGLSPQIAVRKISGSTPPSGEDETISSTSGADTGTTMRYSDGIYIYNLATKSLADATATYEIRITGPFSTVIAQFGTRAK